MAELPDTARDLVPLQVRNSLETILEYLWEDEKRHHSVFSDSDSSHVFEHLQTVREWLESMKLQPEK